MHEQNTKGAEYTYSHLTTNSQSHESDHTGVRPEPYVSALPRYSTSIPHTRTQPDWYRPTLMVVCYALGIAVAVSHHCYNSFWNDKPVTSSQIWINRGGVAFAFLTRMFFAVAASTAYVQQQHLTMHSHSFLLPEMDILFGVLGDAKKFRSFGFWRRQPLLLLPAVVTWLAPIAAIFAVSPMSTVVRHETNITRLQVPELYLNDQIHAEFYSRWVGMSYPPRMQALALQTALSAEYPNLPYPAGAANASYELTLNHPRLYCQDISSSTIADSFQNINPKPVNGGYVYYSYVPSDPYWSKFNATSTSTPGANIWETLDQNHTGPATLNIFFLGDADSYDSRFHYVSCELWHATQTVLFNFTHPFQNYRVIGKYEYSKPVSMGDLFNLKFQSQSYNDSLSALVMMDMLGGVLAGVTKLINDTNSNYARVRYTTSAGLTQIRWVNATSAITDIQNLFFETTIGYLSEPSMTQNVGADVTIRTDVPKFDYQQTALLTAYGLLAGFSLLCVCIGLRAFYRNGASYTNCFSTILRASGSVKFNQDRSGIDDGADPLPRELKSSEMFLGPRSSR